MIKEKFNLNGKVAVITGASKGIGKAIALGFAEFGAHVVVSSRDEEAVKNVEDEFKSKGFLASSLKCHVGNNEDRINLIENTIKTQGRIDVLVNNAGTNPYFGPIHKMPVEAYQKEVCLPALLSIFGLQEYEVELTEQQYLEQSMLLQLMEPIYQLF